MKPNDGAAQDSFPPSVSPSDFLGVDVGDVRLNQILRPADPLVQNGQPTHPRISRNCEEWMAQLLTQKTPQQQQRFFDQPPPRIREFMGVDAASGGSASTITKQDLLVIIRKDDRHFWTQLDKLAPGWVDQAVVTAVVSTDRLTMFQWIADRHPEQIQEHLGITPVGTGAAADAPWRLVMDEDGTGRRMEMFLRRLRSADQDIAHWIWSQVVELSAYWNGNPQPWRAALSQQHKLQLEGRGPNCIKDPGTLPGALFAQETASLIDSLEYLSDAPDQITEFLDRVRPWLSAPVLQNPELARALLPVDCDLSGCGLALGFGTTANVLALFADPECVAGYTVLLKMRANQPAFNISIERLSRAEPEMGWGKDDLQMETSSNHGLIEAALLVGHGATLEQLLERADGVRLIQRVLAGTTGPRCLAQMGNRMGWRDLGERVIRQAAAWSDWRDGRGNTISHWLSFAYNKIGDKTAWTAHQALARAFPQHMSQSNDCGYEPTAWMPRLHSERIAEQVIRKAGRISAAERTQRPSPKHRAI